MSCKGNTDREDLMSCKDNTDREDLSMMPLFCLQVTLCFLCFRQFHGLLPSNP